MSTSVPFKFHSDTQKALAQGLPIVALESTVIAHGLPHPQNVEASLAMEEAVRSEAAVPATIAILAGQPTIGISADELKHIASPSNVLKASRRDLAVAIAGQHDAATTVAGTMLLAHLAGIRVFATGGIGGVHRPSLTKDDVSADLFELARLPIAVVCSGAKSILDIPRTLELLESYSVPVIGYRTDRFPEFYLRGRGEPVSARLDEPAAIADFLITHWDLGGAGVVIVQPAPKTLDEQVWEQALAAAEAEAVHRGVRGKQLTPFLLAEVARATAGETLEVNHALLVENAQLAARIAVALQNIERKSSVVVG